MLAIIAAGARAPAVAVALVLVMIRLVLDSRRWVSLAGRSGVGACSEDAVRGALAVLEAEGCACSATTNANGVASCTVTYPD